MNVCASLLGKAAAERARRSYYNPNFHKVGADCCAYLLPSASFSLPHSPAKVAINCSKVFSPYLPPELGHQFVSVSQGAM